MNQFQASPYCEQFFTNLVMEIRNIKGRLDMTKAIQENDHSLINRLLAEKFDIDAELMQNKYPIMLCIEANALSIGKTLISHGCSLSLKNRQGQTPLHLAVQLLNFDFAKLLLENRADLSRVDNLGKSPLRIAMELNSEKLVELLLKWASQWQHKKGDRYKWEIHFLSACSSSSDEVISLFLDCGYNEHLYNDLPETPLTLAASNFNISPKTIYRLLDAGANIHRVNRHGKTALWCAMDVLSRQKRDQKAYNCKRDICITLIDQGSNVNSRNELGESMLHVAVTLNDEPLTKKLLNAGGRINVVNYRGLCLLCYACRLNFQDMAALLMDFGASTQAINYTAAMQGLEASRETAYHMATYRYVYERARECRDLRSTCRLVIRRNLPKRKDLYVSKLPLPTPLVKFMLFC